MSHGAPELPAPAGVPTPAGVPGVAGVPEPASAWPLHASAPG
jgi:hypothetical protein